MRSAPLFIVIFSVFVFAGCATRHSAAPATAVVAPVAPATPSAPASGTAMRSEQIRTGCIQGRRLICGKVLKVYPDGLVVDSGYTDLLRPPLTESWVVPGNVAASRNPAILELNQPGTPGIGTVFLTDIPKRPTVKAFDYVIIMGYPAGQYRFAPAPGVEKTIRKFSCGLDTAVRLILKTEENQTSK